MNGRFTMSTLLAATLWAFGCGPLYPPEKPEPSVQEIQTNKGDSFVPRRRLLPPPFPPVLKPGLSYLKKIEVPIQKRWGDYLELARVTRPPNDPINDYVLETELEIILDKSGQLVETKVISSSGENQYDAAAQEVVAESAPFARPPYYRLSDDGLMHLTWLFARDRRQAGVGGANFRSIKIPSEILIRKLALEGRPGRASMVLSRESTVVKDGDSLLKLISVVSLEQAAMSGKFEVANHSIDRLADLGVTRSLATLRKIAFSSTWTSDRAIKGLAELRDMESSNELKSVLSRSTDAEKVGAVSEALSTLGEESYLTEIAQKGVASESEIEIAKGLRVMAYVAKAKNKTEIFNHYANPKNNDVKLAAALALGGLLQSDADSEKLLSSCLTSTKNELRLACYQGLHLGVKKGFRSKSLFSHVLLGSHDVQPQVRKISYLIAATAEPERFVKEIQTDHETEDENLLVVVNQLAKIKGDSSTKRLTEYAKSDVTRVRGRAIRGLIDRDDDSARATVFNGLRDDDENVRVEALAATDQYFVPSDFNHSPSVTVKAVALQRWMSEHSGSDLVGEFSNFMAQAKDVNERAFWASLWLSSSRQKL